MHFLKIQFSKQYEIIKIIHKKNVQLFENLGTSNSFFFFCLFFRAIISDMNILKNLDGLNEWRKKEAEELSNIVQKRIRYLQVEFIDDNYI